MSPGHDTESRLDVLATRATAIIFELDQLRDQVTRMGTSGDESARADALIERADELLIELDVVVKRMGRLLTGQETTDNNGGNDTHAK